MNLPQMLGVAMGGLLAACPSFAQTIKEEIADSACDPAGYTAEVSGLSCTDSQFSFRSHGLPDPSHTLMVGIVGNNQQFPSVHNLEFSLPRHPELASSPTKTVPGAIGVAINGVPIFDPSTQGPAQADTGKPVSAAAGGELDSCGGHAGRGDDYHYHRAPNCLIDQMGANAVEEQRRPIGYAADGFPILALGWFNHSHSVEADLDPCRGATDGAGRYFYNVQAAGDQAVLDCLSGIETRFAHDQWDQRKDAAGNDIVGIPIKFAVSDFVQGGVDGSQCSVMQGTLGDEQLLQPGGTVVRPTALQGALFHCSSQCYGQFVEAPWSVFRKGRVLVFEAHIESCAAEFAPGQAAKNAFFAYASVE